MDGSALPQGRRQRRRIVALTLIGAVGLGVFVVAEKLSDNALGAAMREVGMTLLAPVRWVGNLPEAMDRREQRSQQAQTLAEELEAEQREVLRLKARLQRMAALEAENNRLRELLDATQALPQKLRVVPLARLDLHPAPHRAVLGEGREAGLREGQPVLGASGVLGQLRSVTRDEAVLTLATELDHAIPVVIQRHGRQTIVHGTGEPHVFRVSWLPQNADVRIGDLLLTSGLGGRFPPGYPVGVVAEVRSPPGERFLEVYAQPLARIGDSPEVVVVLENAAD